MRSLHLAIAAALVLFHPGCKQPDLAPGPAAEEVEAASPDKPADTLEKREPAARAALVGATVFDATGGEPIPDAVILLEGERIVAVGPRGEVKVPDDAVVHDVQGKWIVPGLVDSHIHFFQSAGLYTRPDIVDLRTVRSYEEEMRRIEVGLDTLLRRYLACGVTAVVDMGGPFWNFDVRGKASLTLLAPRVAVAGPLVSTVSRPQLDLGDPPIIKAGSPEEARALVKKQLERKPDLVKIWFIVTEERGLDETIEIARAAIDEAHAAGVRVAVHATQYETALAAVEAGADVLVHSVDDAKVDGPFITLMKDRGVIYIPTLAVLGGYGEVLSSSVEISEIEMRYGDPAAMATWKDFAHVASPEDLEKSQKRKTRALERAPMMRENLAALHGAGIVVAAGTDAGNIGTLHGASLLVELRLMEEAGMERRDVILSATRDAARVFAAEPEFGTIEPGKLGDLLVIDADPLEDLHALERIHLVVKGGVVLEPGEILHPNPEYVVEKQVQAYNARDIDLFLSYYSQDAVIIRHPEGEVVASGLDAMRETYTGMFEKSPELNCRILERIVTYSMVVDHELVTGIGDRPEIRAVAAYTVEDGLISRVLFLPKD
ncbi:MAG: amidohydrolase family protein [Deltaproteobacteria bacterium]|nr:amidohydrolase family protein [Deltaproteobacteria bacterium]